jgi:hypothetical protein
MAAFTSDPAATAPVSSLEVGASGAREYQRPRELERLAAAFTALSN